MRFDAFYVDRTSVQLAMCGRGSREATSIDVLLMDRGHLRYPSHQQIATLAWTIDLKGAARKFKVYLNATDFETIQIGFPESWFAQRKPLRVAMCGRRSGEATSIDVLLMDNADVTVAGNMTLNALLDKPWANPIIEMLIRDGFVTTAQVTAIRSRRLPVWLSSENKPILLKVPREEELSQDTLVPMTSMAYADMAQQVAIRLAIQVNSMNWALRGILPKWPRCVGLPVGSRILVSLDDNACFHIREFSRDEAWGQSAWEPINAAIGHIVWAASFLWVLAAQCPPSDSEPTTQAKATNGDFRGALWDRLKTKIDDSILPDRKFIKESVDLVKDKIITIEDALHECCMWHVMMGLELPEECPWVAGMN